MMALEGALQPGMLLPGIIALGADAPYVREALGCPKSVHVLCPPLGTGSQHVAPHHHLGQNAGYLRRDVESPLALAQLGGEVAHKEFKGVAQESVALGTVGAEVERRVVEDGRQIGEAVHHFLALAEVVGVIEIGHVNDALEIAGLGERGDDRVHLVADFLVAFERDHVGETATLGHIEQLVLLAGGFVGDVFHEHHDEDVLLLLRGVHAAAQIIATGPEGEAEFGFLEGHGRLCGEASAEGESVPPLAVDGATAAVPCDQWLVSEKGCDRLAACATLKAVLALGHSVSRREA